MSRDDFATKDDLHQAVVHALREYGNRNFLHRGEPKPKREFSKLLIILSGIICAGTWIVAAFSWLMWREFPAELVQYTEWFFVAAVAYLLKSGYENRAKIEKGKRS